MLPRSDTPPHRNTGLVDRLRRSGHKRMPPGKVTPFGDEPVGAGGRKPVELSNLGRGELDAIPDLLGAAGIIHAPAGACVKKLTGYAREMDPSAVFILEFDKAAASAAVAEAFPF